jgi:hypothetical protein
LISRPESDESHFRVNQAGSLVAPLRKRPVKLERGRVRGQRPLTRYSPPPGRPGASRALPLRVESESHPPENRASNGARRARACERGCGPAPRTAAGRSEKASWGPSTSWQLPAPLSQWRLSFCDAPVPFLSAAKLEWSFGFARPRRRTTSQCGVCSGSAAQSVLSHEAVEFV